MVDPPEKLSNDHAYDAQGFCLPNKLPEFFEHGLQPGAIGQLESLADMLVKRLAQGSAMQSAIASAAALLQSADEMKMAELHDPAMVCAEPDNSGNLVGDRSPDPFVYRGGNGCECVRPTPHVLSAWLEHRIEKDGAILMARLERHHIQNPIFPSKSEIKSVQEQNQRSSWQAQFPRSRYELPQRSTKPPTQPLRGKAIAWSESFQCASVHKHCLHRLEDALAEACGHAVSCGFSTFACTDCTDDVENRSDKSWLCNNRISRAMNANSQPQRTRRDGGDPLSPRAHWSDWSDRREPRHGQLWERLL